MITHHVDIEPRWLNRVRGKEKTAEVRRDDRDYQTGDRILLRSTADRFDNVRRTITHVLREAPGLSPGYVVLSLEDPRIAEMAELEASNAKLIRSNRSLRALARKGAR